MAVASVRRALRRINPHRLRATIGALRTERTVVAYWWRSKPNWGDVLNPILIEAIAGKRVVHAGDILVQHDRDVHLVIGSTLGVSAVHAPRVWGAGFISADDTVKSRPSGVHAVRGPLTRARLERQGVACPPVYGDPALLLPRYYRPAVEPAYALGIVPHYVDLTHPWVERYRDDPEVKVLDVTGDRYGFVDDLCRCERVASSSLHGVVAADAYGVPALWVEFSDMITGGGFKFADYFASIGRGEVASVRISDDTTPADLIAACSAYDVRIDLDDLMAACPFAG